MSRARLATRSAAHYAVDALERRTLLAAVAWDGGGNGTSWNDPNNWDNNLVPTAADDVTINVAANPDIQIVDARSVNSLNSSEALTLSGSLNINAASAVNAGFTLTGTLTGNGNVTFNGVVSWNSGTMSGTGVTTISNTGTLNMAGSTKTLARRLVANGPTNWTAGTWNFGQGAAPVGGGTFDNNAAFTATFASGTTSAVGAATGGAANVFNNNAGATLTKAGAGTLVIGVATTAVPFNNAGGTVAVNAGTLRLNAGGSHTSDFAVAATATLELAGTHTFAAGADITGDGNLTVTGGTTTYAGAINTLGTLGVTGGTFTIGGTVNAATLSASGGTINFNNTTTLGNGTLGPGTIGGAGAVTVGGTLAWNAGGMEGAGTTTIATTGTLLLTTGGTKVLARRVINNGGATWDQGQWNWGQNTAPAGAGTFDNNGTFSATTTTMLQAVGLPTGGAPNAFNNNATGTFNKAGSGIVQFIASSTNVPFNNAGGTVNVNAGTLRLVTGGTHTSDFAVAATATLELAGTHTFAAGADITGDGNVAVSGGAVTYPGALNTAGTVTSTGGTFTVGGPVTAGALSISVGTLALDGTGTVTSVTQNSGELSGAGTLTVSGTYAWNAGSMTGAGTTTVAATGTLNIATGTTKTLVRRIVNNGTANWTGGQWNWGQIAAPAGAGTFDNNATFNANTAGDFTAFGLPTGGATNAFNNNAAGTFNKLGTGTVSFSVSSTAVPVNNAGALNVGAGELHLNSGGTHTGDFNITGTGSRLELGGTHTLAATSGVTATAGNTFAVVAGTTTVAGAQNLAGTLEISGGGTTADFNAAVAAVNVNLLAGALGGSGNLTVSGTINWNGGTMQGAGVTTIAPTAALNIATGTTKTLVRRIANNGTTTWTGGQWNWGQSAAPAGGGTFDNNASATFIANTAGSITAFGLPTGGATNAFNNNPGSTFRKQGAGDANFSFSSTGVVFNVAAGAALFVDAGTLSILGGSGAISGGTNSGTATIFEGASLDFPRTYVHDGVTYNGTGTVNFTGGTQTLQGTVTIPAGLVLNFNAGEVTGGDLQVNGTMNWNGGTLTGPGTLNVGGGGTLNLASGATKVLVRPVVNDGTTNWTGGQWNWGQAGAGGAGATFDNNTTFNANSAGTLDAFAVGNAGNVDVFNNNPGATYNKVGAGINGFGFSSFNLKFNNAAGATVNVDGGVMNFNGGSAALSGGTGSGAVVVDPGATVTFGNTYTHDGASYSGGGTINLGGGTQTAVNTVTFAPGPVLNLSGAVVVNTTGSLLANGTTNWQGGTVQGAGTLTVGAAGAFNLTGGATKVLAGRISNNGTATWTAGQWNLGGGTFDNNAGASFVVTVAAGTLGAFGVTGGANAFNNAGQFTKQGAGSTTFNTFNTALPFSNTGTIEVQSGTLGLLSSVTQLSGNTLTGGTWVVRANTTLNFPTGSQVFTSAADVTLDGTASSFPAINTLGTVSANGRFALAGGRDFAVTPGGGTFNNNGTVNLGAGSQLAVTGAFNQAGVGRLQTRIAGIGAANFGQLTATTAATFAGALDVTLDGAFTPSSADTFQVMTFGSRPGNTEFGAYTGLTITGGVLVPLYSATDLLLDVNLAPVAVNDPFTILEDQPTPFNVTANDTDPDHTDANPDTDPPTVFSVNQPLHGATVLNANGTITYTPAADYNGADTFTYTLRDKAGNTAVGTVNVTLTPVNDAPSFTLNAGPTVLEDAGPQTVPALATNIRRGPPTATDEAGQTLTFFVTFAGGTGNLAFTTAPAINPATGALTYTTAPNTNGTATFNVVLMDNGGTANGGIDATAVQPFTITVTPVNDAPSFALPGGNPPAVLEDAGAHSVPGFATNIVPGPAAATDEAGQALTFQVTNNTNAGLFAVQPALAPNGTLTYTPAANANGSAVITVRLTDNGGTANGGVDVSPTQQFTINVTPVNDVPSFTRGPDQTVLEDTAAQAVPNWATAISAGPANESGQTLAFQIVGNTNPALFSVQPAVAANGTLTYTPAPNANGNSTITIRLGDNGGTANGGVDTSPTQQFIINVTPVNDAPSFTKGPDQTVPEDAPAQSVPNWATAISAGPANEAGQLVTFSVAGNTNPGLFTVQPAVAPNGTLTYTLAPNANGASTITIRLGDNGGTANGGADTSAPQSFTITATEVNDAPTAATDVRGPAQEDTPLMIPAAGLVANDSPGPANEAGQSLAVTAVAATPDTHGTVVLAAGVITYTPDPDYFGPASFSYTVTDNGTTNGVADPRGATGTVTLTVNPAGPKVVAVYVRGAAWQPAFLNYLGAQGLGDAALGYKVNSTATTPDLLPWVSLNQVAVQFDADLASQFPAGNAKVQVHTRNVGNAAGSPDNVVTATFLSYDAARRVAIYTLPTALAATNKVLVSIRDTDVNKAGAALDGNGDGAPGGNFNYRFNLVTGDARRDGTPDVIEAGQAKQRTGASPTNNPAQYSIFFDVNGNGVVDVIDAGLIKQRAGAQNAIGAVGGEPTPIAAVFGEARVSLTDRLQQDGAL